MIVEVLCRKWMFANGTVGVVTVKPVWAECPPWPTPTRPEIHPDAYVRGVPEIPFGAFSLA